MRYDRALLTSRDVAASDAGFEATTPAADLVKLYRMVQDASRLITQATQRMFVPYVETKTFDARGDHIEGGQTLHLRDDLLTLTTLTNGDSTVIGSTAYTLLPTNAYPKRQVKLLTSGGYSWAYSDDYEGAISIAGIWGYHEDWPNAWVDTLEDVPVGGITASATTITVTDADGVDAEYRTRFYVGDLLKIESEYLQVQAVNVTTNVLTVKRGARGTTAAIHAEGVSIARFAVMDDVQRAATSLAVWLYRNRETVGDRLQFLDGTTMLSNEVPRHIQSVVAAYRGSV